MPLELPTRDVTVYWYLGADDELAQGGQEGVDDLGTPIELVARTNEYSAQGIGGEAMWTNVYLALRRSNDDTLTLRLTPVIDDVARDPIDVALAAVAAPIRQIIEVGLAEYYPSAADPQISTAMRGTTFALELRTVGVVPAGRLVIEGVEVEWTHALEGQEAANASA